MTASSLSRHHRLRIICVNDVYSFTAVDGHGGWGRAATLMRKLKDEISRNETEQSSSSPSSSSALTFVNGDVMGGSSLLQHSKGRLAIEIMNVVPIDGCVLGNHEFDYGPTALQECINASHFNWFGSNVIQRDTQQLLEDVLDYQVQSLPCGIKIGIFGLCTRATPQLSNPTDAITFLDVEDTARRVVTYLRKIEGVHIVIALTHLAAAQDRQLSEAVRGIDVILGGHDHEPLALEHHHTLIFKCGQNGYWVGAVDLDVEFEVLCVDSDDDSANEGDAVLDSDSVRIFPSWHMHSTNRVEADTGIKTIVDRHQTEVDKEVLRSHGDALRGMHLEDVVATVVGDTLDTRTTQVRRKETTSGNLIADAMLDYYTKGFEDYFTTDGVETMAMINGGFIRGDTRYPNGTRLTLRDVLEEMPFPKLSCLIQLQGKHLRLAMEQQLRACPAATGGFPHLSRNAKIEYGVSAPPLRRIRRFLLNGCDVEDEKRYRVIVTDFVASGGDGASAWCFGVQQAIEGRPSQRVSIIVLNYLQGRDAVDLRKEGRVTCIE